jgi:hypothetical protein
MLFIIRLFITVLLLIGNCGLLFADSSNVLIEDPLDGSIVPAWRIIPGNYIRLAEHGMVYHLQPKQSGSSSPLPWVGDQSWEKYRIEIEFIIKNGENSGFIGLQFHVQEDSVRSNNIGFFCGGELPSERWMETSAHYSESNLSWKLWPFSQKSFDLLANTWTKLRIDVGETIANVYVNNDTLPVYTTYALPYATGGVRFWSYGGSAYLKNFKITDLSEETVKPKLSDVWLTTPKRGLLEKWNVTPLLLPEISIDSLPPQITTDQIEWQRIRAEQRGLINLSAIFPDNNLHRIVFARTYVSVSEEGPASALFSYTDRANVWCNGKLVYRGSARGWYDKEGRGVEDGFGRLLPQLFEFDIPLDEGENVIIIGLEIKEPQFGSGFHLRLR